MYMCSFILPSSAFPGFGFPLRGARVDFSNHGFVWVHVASFLHSVASPFHSFVTTLVATGSQPRDDQRLRVRVMHVDAAAPCQR